jgi:hypothetical protein
MDLGATRLQQMAMRARGGRRQRMPRRQRVGSMPRGKAGGIWYPLFDKRDVANGATSVNFFTGYSATQSEVYTNFPLANQFADPFDWYGLFVQFECDAAVADMQAMINDSVLIIKLSEKTVVHQDLLALGGGGGLLGFTTVAATTLGSNGMPDPNSYFKHYNPISCRPGETFNVQVKWGAAVTMSATTKLGIYLPGIMYRRPMA